MLTLRKLSPLLFVVLAFSLSADTKILPSNVAKRFLRLTSDPVSCQQGDVWINVTSGLFKGCNPDATVTVFTIGGITQPDADVRYLKLAADNDPLLAQLSLAATGLSFPGSTSGSTTLVATAIAGATALILPAASDTLVGKATTDVFTNKSLAFGTNTVTGTLAQFNTACTDCDFARIDLGQTFSGTNIFSSTITGAVSGNSGTATALQNARTINGDSFDGTGNIQNTLASTDFANQGTTTTLLHGNGAGSPSFGSVVSADINATTTTCTNQFLTALSSSLLGTCTTITLSGAQFANQGTTTTVLHGNASGNPSFAVVTPSDASGNTSGSGNFALVTQPQFVTSIGIGTAAPADPTMFVATTATAGAATVTVKSTDGSGTSSFSRFQALNSGNDTTYLATFGAGYTGVFAGVTAARYGAILHSGGNGILMVTQEADPIIIATNNTAAINISGTQVVTIPTAANTAGTLTSVTECALPGCWTCRSWTNAMVVALGATTAGDIAWGTLPAKTIVKNAYAIITGAATGPAAVTVALGRTSSTYIDYIVASDAKAAANTVYGDASAERGTNLTGYDMPSYTGTTLINLHFISTGANLSTVLASTGQICLTTEKAP